MLAYIPYMDPMGTVSIDIPAPWIRHGNWGWMMPSLSYDEWAPIPSAPRNLLCSKRWMLQFWRISSKNLGFRDKKKTMFWKTQSMAFKFQTFGNLSTSSFRCFGNLFPVHAPFIFSQISMSSNWFEDGGAMDNCVNLRKKQLLALLSKGFSKPQMLFLISDVQVASAKSTFEWGPQQWVIDFIKRFSGKDCCLTPNHRLKLLGCRCHLIP